MIPRRLFLRSLSIVPAFPLMNLSCSGINASPGMVYLKSILDILKKIRKNEINSIRDAANLFAETIISRNRCFIYTADSATSTLLNETVKDLPRVFFPLHTTSMAETVREGDALLTTHPGEIPETAVKKGAYTIGITSPGIIDCYDGKDTIQFSVKQYLKPLTNTLIHSYLPIWDGLVMLPEYPFGILPGSAPVHFSLITAIAGETYGRSGGIGLTGNSIPEDASHFLDTLLERITRLVNYRDTFRKAGEIAAGSLLKNGRVWVYDGQGILRKEIISGAGVPLFAHSISRKEIGDGTLKAGDVLLFGALGSNNSDDLNVIRQTSNITDKIITFCPHDETGGYRLYNDSAVSLDNLSHDRNGLRIFDNGQRRSMHTGIIMNSILLWTVLGEATGFIIHSGEIPCYLMGTYLAGSQQYNADARLKAEHRGY